MSQVPNRYFNNQVIADVGRNLSLAIAGDPERDAARLQQKQIEANMLRQTRADQIADKQRQDAELAQGYLADAIAWDPNDKLGKVSKFSEAIRLGANPAASKFLGTADPGYEADVGKLDARNAAEFARLNAKIEATKEGSTERAALQRELGELRAWVTMRGQDTTANTADKNRTFKEKALAAKDANGNQLLKVSSDELDDLMYEMGKYLRTKSGGLAPDLQQDVLLRASQHMQTERNAGTAIAKAMFDMGVEDSDVKAGQSNWFADDIPAQLIPKKRPTREWLLANPPGGAARNTASATQGVTPGVTPTSFSPGSLGGVFDVMNPSNASLFQPQNSPPVSIGPPESFNPDRMVKEPPTFTKLEDAYKALKTGDAYIGPDGQQRTWNKEKYEAKYRKGGR